MQSLPSVTIDRVGILVTTCNTCGTAGIYFHNSLIAQLNLYSSSSRHQVLMTLPTFALTTGAIAVKSMVNAKTVRIDGIALSRD